MRADGPLFARQVAHIVLASCRTALSRERKNPSRIAQENHIFWILLGWFPRWSRSITQGLKFTTAQSVDQYDNICETFSGKKIAISLWIVVFVPCSETDPNLRHSSFSSIVVFSILKV